MTGPDHGAARWGVGVPPGHEATNTTAPDQSPASGLRDRIRDAFHAIAPDCVAYHATDCIDCTTRADAVMADIQREFDQHWADLACRTNERDQWREEARLMTENRDYWRDQVAKEWRQRAEAAEERLNDIREEGRDL